MKKTTLVLSAALLMGASLKAQTKDITVVVAPSAGYTFWNKNLNLGHSPYWGVRAGFAIGPLVEVRGVYEKSFDLKGKLQGSGWSFLNNISQDMTGSSADVSRIGGELKLNVWSNALLTPYITAGAGVMTFKYNDPSVTADYKEEQLYTALGAGLKINLAKRIALALEAKNHLFNVNSNNRFLSLGTSGDKVLHNWTAQASLDFYLGGNKYSDDAVSKAYRSYYGNGFKGLKFVIEPGITYLDFHKDSYLRDTYMLGGSAGVDFGQYLGLRAFYYQSTKTANTLNLKFGDDLRMYGGNLIARLNVSRGVTPYLSLGAGYLNVDDNYVDAQGTNLAKSGWFALGGAGLEVPLHRTLVLYGQANAMLNEQDNSSLSQTAPADVKVNWALQAGLRINLGKKSDSGEDLYQAYATRQVNAERELNNSKINELRSTYDARIDSLNNELTLAMQQRAEVETLDSLAVIDSPVVATPVVRVDSLTRPVYQTAVAPQQGYQLTDADLDRLAEKIAQRQTPQTTQQSTQELSDFDRLLLLMAAQNKPNATSKRVDTVYLNQTLPTTSKSLKATKSQDEATERRIQALEKDLDRRLERMESLLNSSLRSNQQPVVVKVESEKSRSNTTTPIIHNFLTPQQAPATTTSNLVAPVPESVIVPRDTVYKTVTDTVYQTIQEPVIVEQKAEEPLQTIYFASGSSKVDAGTKTRLFTIAEEIKATTGTKVVLRGYASPEGNERSNYALATARCQSVARMLIEYGVSPSSIEIDPEAYILRNASRPSLARCVTIERR